MKGAKKSEFPYSKTSDLTSVALKIAYLLYIFILLQLMDVHQTFLHKNTAVLRSRDGKFITWL